MGQVLATLRVEGAVLSIAHVEAPFAVTSGRPGTGVFHAVLRGEAWAATASGPAVRLEPGRVAVLPSGAEHVISSAVEPDVKPVPVTVDDAGALPAMRVANGGALTEVLCGTITFEESPAMSITAALPEMVVTGSDTSAGWVQSTVALVADELGQALSASEVVAARLADVLVVRALREMVWDGVGHGWAAGVRDPAIGRSLALIHGDPAGVGSVADLARAASMSRSLFYERFSRVVGVSSGEYAARWRIHVACGLLRKTSQPVSSIARGVGFRAEAGFSTAFKRLVGVPPSAYRRQVR